MEKKIINKKLFQEQSRYAKARGAGKYIYLGSCFGGVGVEEVGEIEVGLVERHCFEIRVVPVNMSACVCVCVCTCACVFVRAHVCTCTCA